MRGLGNKSCGCLWQNEGEFHVIGWIKSQRVETKSNSFLWIVWSIEQKGGSL